MKDLGFCTVFMEHPNQLAPDLWRTLCTLAIQTVIQTVILYIHVFLSEELNYVEET